MVDSDQSEQERRRRDRDEIIIATLAAGGGYEEAARLAPTSTRTVRRRMSDPSFAAAVSVRRGERVTAVTGRLIGEAERALDVITASLDSESEPVRLKAAGMILAWGARMRGAHELEQRLEALEARRDLLPTGGMSEGEQTDGDQ